MADTQDTRSAPIGNRKRYRTITAKPGQLRAAYGRADGDGPDICGAWQGPGPRRADMNLLLAWLSLMPIGPDGKTLVGELIARGYDITTLKFSIQHKMPVTSQDGAQIAEPEPPGICPATFRPCLTAPVCRDAGCARAPGWGPPLEGKVPLCSCMRCQEERRVVTHTMPGPLEPGWAYACACGNKRCPHHEDHRFRCTGSNEPGQVGELMEGEAGA